MKAITLVKNALGAIQRTLVHGNRMACQKKRQKLCGKRLTLCVATLFAGICLLSMAASATGGSTAKQTPQDAPTSTEVKGLAAPSTVISAAKRETTLSTSTSATLTMYSDKSSDAAPSYIVVDESTKNQSYSLYGSKREVTALTDTSKASQTSQASMASINATVCPLPTGIKILKRLKYFGPIGAVIIGQLTAVVSDQVCKGVPKDFLTSQNGILFTFPEPLTTGSVAIQNLVKIMQGVALLFLTPVIMLIGLSFITQFTNMTRIGIVSYPQALESLPRLVLSLIGVSVAWLLADQMLQFGSQILSALWATFQGAGLTLDDINNMVFPAVIWKGWLVYLFIIGIIMLSAQVIAPLAVLGNTFGAVISIALVAAITPMIVTDAGSFVVLALSMALGAGILVRIILIDFYIILSPLAMIAAGLPGQMGVKFARDWIYGFCSLIVSQIAQVAALGVGMVVLAEYGVVAGTTSNILGEFIKFATLAIMLRVPGMFKSDATGLVKQVGSLVASTVQHEKALFY